MGDNEKIQCMSVQADLSRGDSQRATESKDILQKIDLSGIDKWDPKMQQETPDLICEHACIFLQIIWILAKPPLSNIPSN